MNRTEQVRTTRGISAGWLNRTPVRVGLMILALLLAAVVLQGREFLLPRLPMGDRIEDFWRPFVAENRHIFQTIRSILLVPLLRIEAFYLWLPWPVWVAATGLAAWKLISWKAALVFMAGLLFIVLVGLWHEFMITLGIVSTSMLLTIAIALPLGILAAKNDRVEGMLRPILDGMQTIPAYVYLLPAIMLLGGGKVTAVAASLVFAAPPAIRLTNLGLRQVSWEIREAAHSFGASPRQMLLKVELPLALPTIMAGINQSTMMAVSMVVIAAVVGAAGLGEVIFFALSRVRIGLGVEAGLAILIMAIILDRLTQALGNLGNVQTVRRE
jgi:glycine betaine/proline transport system permease protein